LSLVSDFNEKGKVQPVLSSFGAKASRLKINTVSVVT
jgi:hypothetical protein